jgi:hypothetical protein
MKSLLTVLQKMARDTSDRKRFLTDWTVRESNHCAVEIFRTRPDRPWNPPIFPQNGYRVSFPGVERPGRDVDHPPLSNAKAKERIDLYFCFPSRPSWFVLGCTLPFNFYKTKNEMCEANSTYCKEKKFTVFYPGNLQGNQPHIDLGFNRNIM